MISKEDPNIKEIRELTYKVKDTCDAVKNLNEVVRILHNEIHLLTLGIESIKKLVELLDSSADLKKILKEIEEC